MNYEIIAAFFFSWIFTIAIINDVYNHRNRINIIMIIGLVVCALSSILSTHIVINYLLFS